MRKILLVINLLLSGFIANSQSLEKIIVEKYYISDAKDATVYGGALPIGSTTYRIYVDMLPGYKFQAVYGLPTHELRLATTTSFFNNEDRGTVTANAIPMRNLNSNTVMLDSWLSVGAASEGTIGILKTDDKELETVVNKDNVLQNDDPAAGIPIKIRDGLLTGIAPRVTSFGIDEIVNIFNNTNKNNSNVFSTNDGSWACMEGAVGPGSDNRVLIAQLTTNGVLSFELNIQIGTPGGEVEQYVARNASGKERLLDSLIYPQPAASNNPSVKGKTFSK